MKGVTILRLRDSLQIELKSSWYTSFLKCYGSWPQLKILISLIDPIVPANSSTAHLASRKAPFSPPSERRSATRASFTLELQVNDLFPVKIIPT
jgi:hypothetical protein